MSQVDITLYVDPRVCLVDVNDGRSYQAAFIPQSNVDQYENIVSFAKGITYCAVAMVDDPGNFTLIRSSKSFHCHHEMLSCQNGTLSEFSGLNCTGASLNITLSESSVLMNGKYVSLVPIGNAKAVTKFTIHIPDTYPAISISSSTGVLVLIMIFFCGTFLFTSFAHFTSLYSTLQAIQYPYYCVLMFLWLCDLVIIGILSLSPISPHSEPILRGLEGFLIILCTSSTVAIVTKYLFKIVIRESRPRHILSSVLALFWITFALPVILHSFISAIFDWYWACLGYWELLCLIYNSYITTLIVASIVQIFRKTSTFYDSFLLILSDLYFRVWISSNLMICVGYIILFFIKTQSFVFGSDQIQSGVFVILRILTCLNSVLSVYTVDRYPIVIMTMRSFKKRKGVLTILAFQNEMKKSIRSNQDRIKKKNDSLNMLSSVTSEAELAVVNPTANIAKTKEKLKIATNSASSFAQSAASPVSIVGPMLFLNARIQGSVTNRATIRGMSSSSSSSRSRLPIKPKTDKDSAGSLPLEEKISGKGLPKLGESGSKLPSTGSGSRLQSTPDLDGPANDERLVTIPAPVLKPNALTSEESTSQQSRLQHSNTVNMFEPNGRLEPRKNENLEQILEKSRSGGSSSSGPMSHLDSNQ